MTRMDRRHTESLKKEKKSADTLKKKSGKHNMRPSILQSIAKSLLFIIVMIAAFCFYEFSQGKREAKNDEEFSQIEVSDFKGDKVMGSQTNILLLGSDSRGNERGRSDSIMVVSYDTNNGTPKVISFMRDTYVNIPEVGYNKINAAYSFGGPELVRQTITTNFNLPIHYYGIVNFATFSKIIDTLTPKGLVIDAEKTLEVDGEQIEAGKQKMTGHTALQYARFRKDEEGDFGRVRRQQQVMNALLDQGFKPSNLFRIPKAMGKMQGYMTTNIPGRLYPGIGKDFVFKHKSAIEKMVIPVEGTWNYGDYPDAGSVLEIDELANQSALTDFLH